MTAAFSSSWGELLTTFDVAFSNVEQEYGFADGTLDLNTKLGLTIGAASFSDSELAIKGSSIAYHPVFTDFQAAADKLIKTDLTKDVDYTVTYCKDKNGEQ